MKGKALWITETALLLALLVIVQATTSVFGSTLLTGSLVNLVLIISVILVGLSSGLSVALLSPIFAFFFGIGPKFWQIIICSMIGNALLVLIWHFILGQQTGKKISSYVIATISAAVAKFLFLYLSVVQFVVPIVLAIPNPQAKIVSAAFSFPQLLTALCGGILATIILPLLSKALKGKMISN